MRDEHLDLAGLIAVWTERKSDFGRVGARVISDAYQRRIELVDSMERCRIARMEYFLGVHRQGSTS
jgi:hypothetical protein